VRGKYRFIIGSDPAWFATGADYYQQVS
jgi:hypothetical protein